MTKELSRFLPRLSLAPMVDVSFAPYRYLNRIVSKSTILYTPMLVDAQLLRATPSHRSALLAKFYPEVNHNQSEWNQGWSRTKVSSVGTLNGGLVAQISGCIPEHMINAVRLIEQSGFNAINVNMGCPAESAQSGVSGAALMKHAEFVHVLRAMRKMTKLPLSVKCRLGVDQPADFERFSNFINNIASVAEIDHFIVHSRVAMLGMDTKKNLAVPPLMVDYAMKVRRELLTSFPQRDMKVEYNGGINNLLDSLCRGWGLESTPLPPNIAPVHSKLVRKNARQLGPGAIQTYAILEVARMLNHGLCQDFLVHLLQEEPVVDGVMIGRLTMKEILFPAKYDALMSLIDMLRSVYSASKNSEGKSAVTLWLQGWKADCDESRRFIELDQESASHFQISPKLINEVTCHLHRSIPKSVQKSRRRLLEEYLEMAQSLALYGMQNDDAGITWVNTSSYQWLSSFPQAIDVSVPEGAEIPPHEELPFLETRSKAALARFDHIELKLPTGPSLLHSKEWIAPLQSLCANYSGAGAGWRSKIHNVLTEVQQKATTEKWRPLNSQSSDKERAERVALGLRTYVSSLENLLCASTKEWSAVSEALESPIVSEEDMVEIIFSIVGLQP